MFICQVLREREKKCYKQNTCVTMYCYPFKLDKRAVESKIMTDKAYEEVSVRSLSYSLTLSKPLDS